MKIFLLLFFNIMLQSCCDYAVSGGNRESMVQYSSTIYSSLGCPAVYRHSKRLLIQTEICHQSFKHSQILSHRNSLAKYLPEPFPRAFTDNFWPFLVNLYLHVWIKVNYLATLSYNMWQEIIYFRGFSRLVWKKTFLTTTSLSLNLTLH